MAIEEDATVGEVPLAVPVQPGQTVNVQIAWSSRVPRTFARTGVVGDFYFLAQCIPKIGVLESDGWNCHQFHAGTEFFSDFGVYDVRLTVPNGWIIGAGEARPHEARMDRQAESERTALISRRAFLGGMMGARGSLAGVLARRAILPLPPILLHPASPAPDLRVDPRALRERIEEAEHVRHGPPAARSRTA